MHIQTNTRGLGPVPEQKPDAATRRAVRSLRQAVALAALLAGGAAHAVDFGPFTLNGFLKAEVKRGSNSCENCQLNPGPPKGFAFKDMVWADDLNFDGFAAAWKAPAGTMMDCAPLPSAPNIKCMGTD